MYLQSIHVFTIYNLSQLPFGVEPKNLRPRSPDLQRDRPGGDIKTLLHVAQGAKSQKGLTGRRSEGDSRTKPRWKYVGNIGKLKQSMKVLLVNLPSLSLEIQTLNFLDPSSISICA